MKVLEFAFDSREPSNYLPHTYAPNCVCYAGTHDNNTIMGWKDDADKADIAMATRYLGLNETEGFHWGILRGGMSSVADLFVVQMQDYLGLGAEARMNTPGTLGGNWQWRLQKGQIDEALIERIAETARIYGRSDRAWQA
jgi:4-alpha-glucanotransferase